MLKDQYRRIFAYGCMEGFREAVKGHHVAAVCEMLKLLGHGNDMFWYTKHDGELVPWTASELLEKSSGIFLPAGKVAPIEFIGGPLGDILYKGSLLTFLLDRMLQHVLEDGLSPIREIEHILWAK